MIVIVMAPLNYKERVMPYPMKPKAAMVFLVSECIDKVLKQHAVTETSKIVLNEDTRMEIAMDTCDEILRRIEKKGESNEKS